MNYNNMTGLILYSGNPYAIKKIHDQLGLETKDKQRNEIILTKYWYSKMTDAQRSVYKGIAKKKLIVSREPTPYRIRTKRDDRGVSGPITLYANDENNNLTFACNYRSVKIETWAIATDDREEYSSLFVFDDMISRLFYYMCQSVLNGEANMAKLAALRAREELEMQLVDLYKD